MIRLTTAATVLLLALQPAAAQQHNPYEDLELQAMADCRKLAKSIVNYPETFEYSAWDDPYRKHETDAKGQQFAYLSFKAKNGFGVPSRYIIICTYKNRQLVDYSFAEAPAN